MKKIILSLITTILFMLVMAFGLNAQNTYGKVVSQDSIAIHLTDTTKYLSNSDILRLWDGIKDKITAKQSEDFATVMQYIIAVASKEWEQQQNSKKK